MGAEARGSDLALEGMRVLDLTSMWAGPLCTRILADLGAEVIKIEAPMRPDGTRSDPGYFTWLNRNKLGVTMNLNVPEARDRFKQLVAKSDVVVENFTPRVMRNFQLDYPVLRDVKQDIVMLSMPAYGSSGPYHNYIAYGPAIEASSGLAAITGYRDGPPMLSGSAYGDPVAGLHGALAILAALRYRRRTGKGQWIDLAQREALSQMFGEAFVLAAAGVRASPMGNAHPMYAPHGCYRCLGEDRWIAISIRSDNEWRRLCKIMDKDVLIDDPRYRDPQARKANEDDLNREIEEWTRRRDRQEIMDQLQASHLAAGVVKDASDLARDPHLAERGFFQATIALDGKLSEYPGLPWRTGAVRSVSQRPAPALGEHNQQVLGGLLGLSEAEIRQLQREAQ